MLEGVGKNLVEDEAYGNRQIEVAPVFVPQPFSSRSYCKFPADCLLMNDSITVLRQPCCHR